MRPLLGLARAGSYGGEGSGEIGLAFLDRRRPAGSTDDRLNPYFAAAWEASQEAVYNCLVAGQPGELREGGMQDAFPVEEVRRLAAARDERA